MSKISTSETLKLVDFKLQFEVCVKFTLFEPKEREHKKDVNMKDKVDQAEKCIQEKDAEYQRLRNDNESATICFIFGKIFKCIKS